MTRHHTQSALMRYARRLGFGELHTKIDPDTGLEAIVAIHNLNRGPAIGGARCHHYDDFNQAMVDVLRLAQMMSLKSAIVDLPHGGAKSVLIKPRQIRDRQAYMHAFGDFVHQLNGRYVTAVDVGTDMGDMDLIAERTPFVAGYTGQDTVHHENNPSPYTAKSVFRGIQAAVAFRHRQDTLNGIHVAIQGVGHVGRVLTQLLVDAGARVTVTDTFTDNVTYCVNEYGATAVAPEAIYSIECDVFAPCALGGVINLAHINQLKAPIIAGSANNQLAHLKIAETLKQRGILYAPDFVVNAGGLIFAAAIYDFGDSSRANEKIDQLYDTLLRLFERAEQTHQSTNAVTVELALEKLKHIEMPESSY